MAAVAAAPSSLPFRSEIFEAEVEGRRTQFALTGYTDRLLVVASQLGSLGSVLAAEKESVLGGGSTFRIDTLLGRRDEPLAELCARQLVEQLAAAGCDRPLLLCLALERGALTPAAVRQVAQLVMQHPVW